MSNGAGVPAPPSGGGHPVVLEGGGGGWSLGNSSSERRTYEVEAVFVDATTDGELASMSASPEPVLDPDEGVVLVIGSSTEPPAGGFDCAVSVDLA